MAKYKKRILKNPLWGQQEWEENHRFNAFQRYRDWPLESQRSIQKLHAQMEAEIGAGQFVGIRAFYNWQVDDKWDERVLAYDRHLDGLRMRQVKRRTTEMYDRHSTLAVAMQMLVHERLRTLNANDLTARDIKEWMDISARIELRARGESTENVNFNVSDGREQQIERAREFYKKMTLESPTLADRDKAQIVKEAFDVQPFELGLPPDLLDLHDATDAIN